MRAVICGWLVTASALALVSAKPDLQLRASPLISQAPITGCSEILITAQIVGPEVENWYCPEVAWLLPDGTTQTEESDCAPFLERESCWPPQPQGCGLVAWTRLPDGTIQDIVKDCACTITGYPRFWRRRLCAPTHPNGGPWTVAVRLRKQGKTFVWRKVDFYVK